MPLNKTSSELISDMYRNETKRLRRITLFGIIAMLILISGILSLSTKINDNATTLKGLAEENRSLNQVTLKTTQCISLIKPQDRTPQIIKECVDKSRLPSFKAK